MKAPNPPANRFDSPGLFGAARRAAAFASRPGVPRSRARRTMAVCLLFGLLLGQASAAGAVANTRTHAPKPAARKSTKAAQPAAGRKPADASAKAGSEAGKDDGAAAAAQPSPASITIEPFEASDVFAYPSDGGLKKYAIVVKWKDGKFFPTDPSLVSLSLTPAGATDVTIRRVTPTRIEADFWAPDKFKVNDASVTVYDSKNRQLVVASSDVTSPAQGEEAGSADGTASLKTPGAKPSAPKAPKPAEDEEPKINSTTVVFLQRAYGIGRLKIEGEHFGDYEAPPMTAENYLLCFEPLARQALVNALAEGEHPDPEAQQKLEDQRCKNLGTTLAKWNAWREKVEPLVKVALVPRNTDLRIEQTKVLYIDDKLIDVYFEFNRYYRNSEPLRLASATVTVKKPDGQQPATKQQPTGVKTQTASSRPAADGVSVINAAVAPGAGGDDVRPTAQPTPNLKTFIASKEVGTRQDDNLEYRYTVLDNVSAATLFGKGVAESFYVIQLSVTNKGDKKVAVPLASIQAEVEWAYGPDDTKASGQSGRKPPEAAKGGSDAAGTNHRKITASAIADTSASAAAKDGGQKGEGEIPVTANNLQEYYEEGPATLAPLPLPAVTAFFDGDQKTNGTKAKLFNAFDGAAIFATSLVPFLGTGFQKGEGAFTGGFVPGLRRGLGDLSGQQLQNLAALSWQNIEVVSAGGGSVEKFVFIQRRDQLFSPGFGEQLKKTIKNIEGMEVVGFEVKEGEVKSAKPADAQ